MGVVSKKVSEGKLLTIGQARDVVAKAMPEEDFRGRKVLLIVPDGTRTAPVGTMFKAIHDQIGGTAAVLDVMIALGTHQAMSEEAIEQRLDITHDERTGPYARSEEHTSELQSRTKLACRLLLEKKKKKQRKTYDR